MLKAATADNQGRREISVGRNECRIARLGERLVSRNILADVVVAIQVPAADFAALLRFSPIEESAIPKNRFRAISEFADSALTMLFDSIRSMNIPTSEIGVMAIGGADTQGNTQGCGKQITLAVQRSLWRQGVTLQGDDLGGRNSRGVWLDSATGRVIVRSSFLPPDDGSSAPAVPLCTQLAS